MHQQAAAWIVPGKIQKMSHLSWTTALWWQVCDPAQLPAPCDCSAAAQAAQKGGEQQEGGGQRGWEEGGHRKCWFLFEKLNMRNLFLKDIFCAKSNTFCDTFCHKIEIRSMDIGKHERGKYLSSLLKCSWSQLASSLTPSTRAEGVGPGMPCLLAGCWDQGSTALLPDVSNHDQPGCDGGNHLTHHHLSIQCPVQLLPRCMDWRIYKRLLVGNAGLLVHSRLPSAGRELMVAHLLYDCGKDPCTRSFSEGFFLTQKT